MNRKGKWYNRLAVPVAKSIERPKQDEYHGEETFKMSKSVIPYQSIFSYDRYEILVQESDPFQQARED